MRHPTIVSAGYMPLDIIVATGGTVFRRSGGTAANVAAILAFLGWDSALVGHVGDDLAGEELVADLRDAGVQTTAVLRRPDMATPRLVHRVRSEGHSYSYLCSSCQSPFPRSRPLTIERAKEYIASAPDATVFFFDRANAGTLTLAEHFAARGSIVMFEPSVPAREQLLRRAAAVAHVIKNSDDRTVGSLEDSVGACRTQMRIVTHGAGGLAFSVGGRTRKLPALATLAVDTAGAGDWISAGFLAKAIHRGQLNSERFEEALRFGQALSAMNCAVPGARSLMQLARGTVLRRAQNVIGKGGLTGQLRMPLPQLPAHPPGYCPICLMEVSPARAVVVAANGTNGGHAQGVDERDPIAQW